MNRPGSKWKPGKQPGTWFRHVALLGPCVAKDGNITVLRHRITVPYAKGWTLAVVAALPSETVRVTGRCNMIPIDGIVRIPVAAKRLVIWHRDGAGNGEYTVTPADPGAAPTLAVSGLYRSDEGSLYDAVILAPLSA